MSDVISALCSIFLLFICPNDGLKAADVWRTGASAHNARHLTSRLVHLVHTVKPSVEARGSEFLESETPK